MCICGTASSPRCWQPGCAQCLLSRGHIHTYCSMRTCPKQCSKRSRPRPAWSDQDTRRLTDPTVHLGMKCLDAQRQKARESLPDTHARRALKIGQSPAVRCPAVAGRRPLALHERCQDALLHDVLNNALGCAQDTAVRRCFCPAVRVLQPSQDPSAADPSAAAINLGKQTSARSGDGPTACAQVSLVWVSFGLGLIAQALPGSRRPASHAVHLDRGWAIREVSVKLCRGRRMLRIVSVVVLSAGLPICIFVQFFATCTADRQLDTF